MAPNRAQVDMVACILNFVESIDYFGKYVLEKKNCSDVIESKLPHKENAFEWQKIERKSSFWECSDNA